MKTVPVAAMPLIGEIHLFQHIELVVAIPGRPPLLLEPETLGRLTEFERDLLENWLLAERKMRVAEQSFSGLPGVVLALYDLALARIGGRYAQTFIDRTPAELEGRIYRSVC